MTRTPVVVSWARNWSSILMSLIVLGTMVTTFLLFASMREGGDGPRSLPAKPALTVDEADRSFGVVDVTDRFELTLPIRNVTGEAITINGFETSCFCAASDTSSLTIPAFSTQEARFHLDLRPRKIEDASQPLRDYKVFVKPKIGDGDSRGMRWAVEGKIRSSLYPSPLRIEFLREIAVGTQAYSKTAEIRLFEGYSDLRADWDRDKAEVEIVRPATASGPIVLKVTPKSSLPPGRFEFPVNLFGVKGDGSEGGAPALMVVGYIVPAVQAKPPLLSLGVRRLGESVPFEFAVDRADGAALNILNSEAGTEIAGLELVDGETTGERKVRGTYLCAAPGRQQSSVRLVVAQGMAETPIEVRVPVSAYVLDEVSPELNAASGPAVNVVPRQPANEGKVTE